MMMFGDAIENEDLDMRSYGVKLVTTSMFEVRELRTDCLDNGYDHSSARSFKPIHVPTLPVIGLALELSTFEKSLLPLLQDAIFSRAVTRKVHEGLAGCLPPRVHKRLTRRSHRCNQKADQRSEGAESYRGSSDSVQDCREHQARLGATLTAER